MPQNESLMFIFLFLSFHKQSLRDPEGVECVERWGGGGSKMGLREKRASDG